MFIMNKIFLRFLLILPLFCAILLSVILQKSVIFYSTSYGLLAFIGFAVAMVFACFEKSLVKVAAFSCAAVLVTELILAKV